MNIGQFIILTVFFLIGLVCQAFNLAIQINKKDLKILEIILQVGAVIATTVLYGLGVIETFAGLYQ